MEDYDLVIEIPRKMDNFKYIKQFTPLNEWRKKRATKPLDIDDPLFSSMVRLLTSTIGPEKVLEQLKEPLTT